MTRQLKSQTRESAKKAYRTEILLENSRKLRRCKSKEEVWTQVATQVVKLLNLSVIIYPVGEKGNLEEPLLFPKKYGVLELEKNHKCERKGSSTVDCF